jgi:hypothetical protein
MKLLCIGLFIGLIGIENVCGSSALTTSNASSSSLPNMRLQALDPPVSRSDQQTVAPPGDRNIFPLRLDALHLIPHPPISPVNPLQSLSSNSLTPFGQREGNTPADSEDSAPDESAEVLTAEEIVDKWALVDLSPDARSKRYEQLQEAITNGYFIIPPGMACLQASNGGTVIINPDMFPVVDLWASEQDLTNSGGLFRQLHSFATQ